MKKLLLCLFVLALGVGVKAQKWSLGVEAGYLNICLSTERLVAKSSHGFMVGLTTDYTFPGKVTLETGLSYQRRGEKLSGDMGINNLKLELDKADYLYVPVTIGYRIHLTDTWTFTPKVGGYLGVGIRAKGRIDGTDSFGQPFSAFIDFFEDSGLPVDYRPFDRCDVGLQVGGDIAWRRIRLGIGYQFGLKHLATIYDSRTQNRTLSLTLGYSIF